MSDYFVGQIILFGGNYEINGFTICDGRLLNVNDYSALYSLISNTYGGSFPTTFGVPDLRGRVPVHQGQGNGLTNRLMGQMFGGETATVTTGSMPSHSHPIQASAQNADSFTPAATSILAKSSSGMYTSSAPNTPMDPSAMLASGVGDSPQHNNMMPYLALNYQICHTGAYPQRQ